MAPRSWGTFVVEVPKQISRRQFFQVLAERSIITLLSAIVNDDIQWRARMAFSAQTFERANWCVEFFGAMQNMSSADIDDLWRDGAKLD
ncbi:hypothetical protein EVC29_039 [Rhizobium phage RHph_Y52]|nr:hypothetical protein EVC29_039 [Rhizobium phage RHph_Y52]